MFEQTLRTRCPRAFSQVPPSRSSAISILVVLLRRLDSSCRCQVHEPIHPRHHVQGKQDSTTGTSGVSLRLPLPITDFISPPYFPISCHLPPAKSTEHNESRLNQISNQCTPRKTANHYYYVDRPRVSGQLTCHDKIDIS